MRKVIIFDIGGVLRLLDKETFSVWLTKSYNVKGSIWPIWKKWETLKDIGDIDENAFYSGILKDLDISKKELSKELFFNKFLVQHTRTNHELVSFIENELYQKYELFIFSNMCEYEVKNHKKEIDFDKLFNKSIYSYMLKKMKPDIEFYKEGLNIIKHEGKECVFIDDRIENGKNAGKMGIKFIHYVDFNKLIEDINKFKL